MNVEIIAPDYGHDTYEIKINYSTYLFDRATYNALYHAFMQHPADDVVWSSCITSDLVSDPRDCENMTDELDDFVAGTLMNYMQEEDN